jgi:hypothetical protein
MTFGVSTDIRRWLDLTEYFSRITIFLVRPSDAGLCTPLNMSVLRQIALFDWSHSIFVKGSWVIVWLPNACRPSKRRQTNDLNVMNEIRWVDLARFPDWKICVASGLPWSSQGKLENHGGILLHLASRSLSGSQISRFAQNKSIQ